MEKEFGINDNVFRFNNPIDDSVMNHLNGWAKLCSEPPQDELVELEGVPGYRFKNLRIAVMDDPTHTTDDTITLSYNFRYDDIVEL